MYKDELVAIMKLLMLSKLILLIKDTLKLLITHIIVIM